MSVAAVPYEIPSHPTLGTPTAVYPYRNAAGAMVFTICRFDPKDFRPVQQRNGRWVWHLDGVPVLPYRLPDVELALANGDDIWIVDGEKDADALASKGVVATCCARSQGWTLELAEQFTGARRIKIIADRDTNGTGLKQALQVRETLVAAGAIASCDTEILQAAEGKDAYDHLAAGENLNSFLFLKGPELTLDGVDVDTPSPIIFETLRSFLKRDVPQSEALVGVARDGTNLLPRYGWVMPWGKEGSGKTSILVDLLFHACAGIDWLDYAVGRPLKVVAVVNEGVPGGLQDKLRQKTERWEHSDDVLDNLAVYASPWGEFTFANERMVEHAKDFARDFGADYIALDPLHTLGTTGVGSPIETEAFKHVLRNFGLWDWIGIITAHHSNKGGMLSGDWGRHPDTVIHVEKDGKAPATKFTIHKARPADPKELGVPCLLEWVIDSLGYTRKDIVEEKVSDGELLERIKTTLAQADGAVNMRTLQKDTEGSATRISEVAKRALKSSEIVNLSTSSSRFLFTLPEALPRDGESGEAQAQSEEQTRLVDTENRFLTPQEANEDHPNSDETLPRFPTPRRGVEAEAESLGSAENDDIDLDWT